MLNKERLKIAVEESGKSKEEIASEADITVQTLYTYLSGRRDPVTRTLTLLAKATDRSISWLMGESTDENETYEPIVNYRLMNSDAELADPELMKLMEDELDAIRRLRIEKEKQIRSNTRSSEKRTPGTGEKQ